MKAFNKVLLGIGISALMASPSQAYDDYIHGRDPYIPLKESVEAMIRNNHSLRALQENRSAVGHEIDRAKAGWGPRVDLTARGGFGKLSNSTTRSYDYDKASPYSSASLIITQPLWDGFETRGRVREAEATFRSLDHRVMDNANTLALDAIIAHVDVLRRQEIYKLAQENVNYHEIILQKSIDRTAMGVDTVADVSQAHSRLLRAQSTLSEAEAFLNIGLDSYARLTEYRDTPLGPVEVPKHQFENVQKLLDTARANNPKIKAFFEDVNAAKACQEQAKAAYSPKIAIEAGPSYSDRDAKRELWVSEFGVAAVVRWNLFNSCADVAENKAAAARIRQARQGLYDYADELKLAAEESWTQYISATEQYAYYRDAQAYNVETRKAYEEQFDMGQRSLLDVLDAQSELFNTSSQVITARSNTIISAYRMRALAGDLISSLGISTGILKVTPHDHEDLDTIKLPE